MLAEKCAKGVSTYSRYADPTPTIYLLSSPSQVQDPLTRTFIWLHRKFGIYVACIPYTHTQFSNLLGAAKLLVHRHSSSQPCAVGLSQLG